MDDPDNAEVLKDLTKGVVPKELTEGGDGGVKEGTVGLIDKRHLKYEDDCDCHDHAGGGTGAAGGVERSFTGEGQSLGSSTAINNTAVITPPTPSTTTTPTPTIDENKRTTVIQIRLLIGKRLRGVTINKMCDFASIG